MYEVLCLNYDFELSFEIWEFWLGRRWKFGLRMKNEKLFLIKIRVIALCYYVSVFNYKNVIRFHFLIITHRVVIEVTHQRYILLWIGPQKTLKNITLSFWPNPPNLCFSWVGSEQSNGLRAGSLKINLQNNFSLFWRKKLS